MLDRTKLTAAQKRRLACHICGWCGQSLNRPDCGAIYNECSQETSDKRLLNCLHASKKPHIADTSNIEQ